MSACENGQDGYPNYRAIMSSKKQFWKSLEKYKLDNIFNINTVVLFSNVCQIKAFS